MPTRKPLFIGNWKMHKSADEVRRFCESFRGPKAADLGMAPQMPHLSIALAGFAGGGVQVFGQNCGPVAAGAHTGETSPQALTDLGIQGALVGHSERRWVYHEGPDLVASRLKAGLDAGLEIVLCVGERLVDRKEGKTFLVLEEQLAALKACEPARLAHVTVAYEPVWAIGTGETATPDQAQEAHEFIRKWVRDHFGEDRAQSVRVLYGGSAKPDNAEALMAQPDVDGLLVGGASLDPMVFAELVENGLRSAG